MISEWNENQNRNDCNLLQKGSATRLSLCVIYVLFCFLAACEQSSSVEEETSQNETDTGSSADDDESPSDDPDSSAAQDTDNSEDTDQCTSGNECTSNDHCRQTLYPELQSEWGNLLDCEPHEGKMVCMCDNTPCCQLTIATCDDGKKNQGEAGVDCGGPCPACAPSCADGVKNQGEEGVDCGGPCTECGSKTGWRWAHSGDGNQHDPDDWHASAMALALMYKAGLKHKLAHFNWNNHLGDNSSSMKNQHDWHVNTARQTFGYSDDSVFHNCQDNLEGTIKHLKDAINASSADNILVLTCAGPMEVCWRAINEADDEKEQHVVVISHSGWNDSHSDTSQMNHKWNDIENDFDVLAHHINDQNPPAFKSSCNEWNWTKNLPDFGPTFYDLLCKETAAGDASDAGMIYYMIQQDGVYHGTNGNSNPSMADVQSFF